MLNPKTPTNNVKFWRITRKFTQRRLAAGLGCKPSFIHQIENGKRCPSIHTAQKLTRELECSFKDLFPFQHELPDTNGFATPEFPGLPPVPPEPEAG